MGKDLSVRRLKRTGIDPAKWDEFVEASPNGSIYGLSGYLDAVAKDWEAIVLSKEDEWQAIWPFCIEKKAFYLISHQPPFSQGPGLMLKAASGLNRYKTGSWKKAITEAAIAAFPKVDWFAQKFSPEFDYPFPFHWEGYKLQTRYTYHLEMDQEEASLFTEMRSSTKKEIRKFSDLEGEMVSSSSTDGFIEIIRKNEADGKRIFTPSEIAVFPKLVDFLTQTSRGRIYEYREEGAPLAAILLASFREKLLYLAGASLPGQSPSPVPGLLWGAAKDMKGESHRILDFEGSMIKGIEAFFRGFGGKAVPYLFIEKNDLPLLVKWVKKYS